MLEKNQLFIIHTCKNLSNPLNKATIDVQKITLKDKRKSKILKNKMKLFLPKRDQVVIMELLAQKGESCLCVCSQYYFNLLIFNNNNNNFICVKNSYNSFCYAIYIFSSIGRKTFSINIHKKCEFNSSFQKKKIVLSFD